MRKSLVSGILLGVVVAVLGSGCALSDLKDANERLVEARDRLLSENNRLDNELKTARQEIGLLQSELNSAARVPPSPPPVQVARSRNIPTESSPSAASELIIPDTPGSEAIVVEHTPLGIKLTIDHKVFFASGQAKLSTRGQALLRNTVAPILNRGDFAKNTVRVEGHTDDVPVRKVRHLYPTNWELSTARACTVVRYLVDTAGIRRDRIYPSGFSSTRPIVHGKSAVARGKNRRVEILILNKHS